MTLRVARVGSARVILALAVAAAVCCSAAGGMAAHAATDKGTGTSRLAGTQAGSTLVYGQTQGITQLDPNINGVGAAEQLYTLLWNGLTKWAPNMTAVPDLATSWTHTKDYRVWTFKLRSGVKFANGKPFTARDAVKNIVRVLNPNLAAPARLGIASIRHVTAVNNTTLRIQLSQSSPTLPELLVPVKMTDVANIASINTNPNGTGPYMLKSFVPNQLVDLVANPHYFGAKPKIHEIKIVTYSDISAAEAALSAGNLDFLWDVPPTQVSSVAANAHATVLQTARPSGAFVIELDTTSPPFNNPVAREALSYAVDRPELLKVVYGNFGIASLTNDIVSPKDAAYARGAVSYRKNLATAKRLFAQAGVTSLVYSTIPSSVAPEFVTAGEVLQQDLASIGVSLKIEQTDVGTWVQSFYPRGHTYPGVLIPNRVSFASSAAALQWFSDSGGCECNWKPGSVYDKASTVATTSPSASARAHAYATMQQMLNKDVPELVVVNASIISAALPSVKGVWIQSDGTPHVENASLAG